MRGTWRERAKGTGSITALGYLRFKLKGGAQKMAHVLIAEKALGKPLPSGAVVHHINGDPLDNRNENLLICMQSYHILIHRRMKAYADCGNPDWRTCKQCKKYDAPENLRIRDGNIYHVTCQREYDRKRTGVTRPFIAPEMGNKVKCSYCKQYDEPEFVRVTKYNKFHPVCRSAYDKARNERARCVA